MDVRALAVVEAYSDGLNGHLLAAAQCTPMNEVQALMGKICMQKQAKVWIEPIHGQLLKPLKSIDDLILSYYEDPTGTACFGSVIHQHALAFLRKNVPEITVSVTQHLCFVLRQNTNVASDTPVRNLRHGVLQEMVKGIADPCVGATPRISGHLNTRVGADARCKKP